MSSKLVIRCKMGKMMSRLPRKIWVSGQFIGVMQQPEVSIQMPPGIYQITIQSIVPYFSASTTIQLLPDETKSLEFRDRERGWDILFGIDIVLWIVKRFLHLAAPWTWIYEIFTNGYFILWLFYEWKIRKKYYALKVLN
ncbi:MAG: hypothetical protein MJZ42_01870 [Bacteroidales bacterium]|nr:hypothetical protein [Bacteroidales bacterium]